MKMKAFMGKLQNIFSDKLLELCQSKKSISKVAADLSINRQQFARYLNRTSIPREETIERIAEYFGVSPTFFFTSDTVEKTGGGQEKSKSLNEFFDIFRNTDFGDVSPKHLSPGLYVLLKPSFTQSGRLLKSIVQVKYLDSVAHYKTIIYCEHGRGYALLDKVNLRPAHNQYDKGVFLKTDGKLIMLNASSTLGHTALHVFLVGHHFDHNIKPGVHFVLSSSSTSAVRSSTMTLRKILPTESVLSHARTIGWIENDQVSKVELDILSGGTFDYPGIIGI